jgi:hypothetical protein
MHNGEITCMAWCEKRRLVVTGQAGERPESGMFVMWDMHNPKT